MRQTPQPVIWSMRAFIHYLRVRFAVLPVVDALVLVGSMVLGYQIRLLNEDGLVFSTLQGVLFATLMMLTMTAFGLYSRQQDEPFRQVVQKVFASYLVTLLALSVVFYVFPDSEVGRGVFAIASVFGLMGILVVRYVAYRAGFLHRRGRRVMVMGEGEEADQVLAILANQPRAHLVAQVPASGRAADAAPDEKLIDVARRHKVSHIVVAAHERRGGRIPLDELLECKLAGIQVMDLLSFYEQELGLIRLSYLRTGWLVYGDGFSQGTTRAIVKRLFDVSVASCLLLLASPVMLITAVVILLETGRPIFFRQERVCAPGQSFDILKFRSMVQDAEKDGPRWATVGDARITRVGQFIRLTRIDELPQLINVLRGEMSFVGPRPERPYFVEKLNQQVPYYDIRHYVKPGITGWAQVRMDYGASVEEAMEKLEYDLFYVKNHSLFLDFMVLFETIQVVLRKKGAR
ncbi:TIGR03013 family PEP-CTERM/XrtA system glycosyltransferase [Lautropia dentalis]|uniref:TIGR03013 family PEP-CTERM/XrtA system glycosyltransferase n=2 Tax=Lautropia dentalis TaxID=2490857 RepID=A0A3R8T0W0_9BURK|nr:TIGR03013 family PEP-CTERM/XrtA system glycosyltransferase [Lautropia dentalis]